MPEGAAAKPKVKKAKARGRPKKKSKEVGSGGRKWVDAITKDALSQPVGASGSAKAKPNAGEGKAAPKANGGKAAPNANEGKANAKGGAKRKEGGEANTESIKKSKYADAEWPPELVTEVAETFPKGSHPPH